MPFFDTRNKEKRKFIRMNLEAEVLCKMSATGDVIKGKCSNLSHNGIQFITEKQIDEGAIANISVNVNTGSIKPLTGKLTVTRVTKQDNNNYLISGELNDVK